MLGSNYSPQGSSIHCHQSSIMAVLHRSFERRIIVSSLIQKTNTRNEGFDRTNITDM